MHALALQFTRSATPPYIHLTSFYIVLAVIGGLGTRLPLLCQVLQHALKWLLVLQSHIYPGADKHCSLGMGLNTFFSGFKDQAKGLNVKYKSHSDVANLVTGEEECEKGDSY